MSGDENQVALSLANIDVPVQPVVDTAQQILHIVGLHGVELSILLCDNQFIWPLNRDYRGKDAPTDVLSFAQREGEGADPNDPILGDVIISIERAAEQAPQHGKSLEDELKLLLVHGVLHLLGYDHIDAEEAEEMEHREREILSQLTVEWSEFSGYSQFSARP